MNGSKNQLLRAQAGKVLIAAHRGTCGGNIIQNTVAAYENALRHGADIIEADVAQTTDGIFFVFHTGQEPGVLGTEQRLDTMTSDEVMEWNLINSMQEVTAQKVNRLDEVLEYLRGKAYINIDRGWFYMEQLLAYLAAKDMTNQLLFKCPPKAEYLDILEVHGKNVMYMPIIHAPEELEAVLQRPLNMKAVELIFKEDTDLQADRGLINRLHNKGIAVWANAITLDDKTVLTGGHDDNHAILKDMEYGWGWLIDRGFDIIQTDWPMLLSDFTSKRRTGL